MRMSETCYSNNSDNPLTSRRTDGGKNGPIKIDYVSGPPGKKLSPFLCIAPLHFVPKILFPHAQTKTARHDETVF